MKLTTTTNIFLATNEDPRRIVKGIASGDRGSIGQLAFVNWEEMGGWVKLGAAIIEMELDVDSATEGVIAALRAQLESNRADFALKQKQINDRINSMLAIEYVPRDTMQQFGDDNHNEGAEP